jgi:Domain of unknown function (DUF4845)
MNHGQRQRGLTILGFLFVAVVAVAVVMIGARMGPAYLEWYTVQKVLRDSLQASKDGFTLYQFRRDFDLKASADYIESVRGADVEVTKDGDQLVATASWSRVLHLVGNVSLLLEFEATATK